MEVLKTILLVFQLISCAVLTVIILLQSSKSDGMSALTGSSDTFLGRSKAATLDAKLERLTKWVAAAFVLLTLFVALLYSM